MTHEQILLARVGVLIGLSLLGLGACAWQADGAKRDGHWTEAALGVLGCLISFFFLALAVAAGEVLLHHR